MYDTIEVNDASVEKLMKVVHCEQHTSYEGMLESPFEPKEIYRAIQAGGRKKAPGNDVLGREFYSHNWAVIKDDLCEIRKHIAATTVTAAWLQTWNLTERQANPPHAT